MKTQVRAGNDEGLMALTLELDNREAQALLKLAHREIDDHNQPMENDEIRLAIKLREAAIKYQDERFDVD